MQDLIDKIEQLRKSLAAMKPKSGAGESQLVPAVKLPSIKPLSMPSATAAPSKPVKMPGITPGSGKDPKKMAEQLKDPKPHKTKVEVLKCDKNGQWSLEKVHQPVSPDKPGISHMGADVRRSNKMLAHPEHGRAQMRAAYPHTLAHGMVTPDKLRTFHAKQLVEDQKQHIRDRILSDEDRKKPKIPEPRDVEATKEVHRLAASESDDNSV